MKTKLVLSCEHGGNQVPKAYQEYFASEQDLLESHRAWDIGALSIFKRFEENPHIDYSKYSNISRLLIELNRSLHHPKLFSEITKSLNEEEKSAIIQNHYLPYRNEIESWIGEELNNGNRVIHLSVHTFTPFFNGKIRKADVGLLYDPESLLEKQIVHLWRTRLKKELNKNLIVRLNYPYLGKADGFTSYLRKQFKHEYAGIELEINNQLAVSNSEENHQTLKKLVDSYFSLSPNS